MRMDRKEKLERQPTDGGKPNSRDQKFGNCLKHRASFEPARVMAHHRIEKKEVRDRDHAGRERKPAVAPMETKGKEPVEGKVYGDGGQGYEHRHIAFVQSVKRGREHF